MEPQIEIIFCEGFQNQSHPNTPPTISNPLSCIQPYAIPGNYSFSVFCTIDHLPANQPIKISIEIGEVDGSVILPETLLPVNQVNKETGEFASVKLGIDLRNAIITQEGEIYVRLKENDDFIGEKKITVKTLAR